jgi:hypothetical protein
MTSFELTTKETYFSKGRLTRWGIVALSLLVLILSVVIWKDRHRPVDPYPQLVNDSTQILQAENASLRSELRALKATARKLRGELAAGVRVEIHPETVYVAASPQPTDSLADGTRVATVRDTTADGLQVNIDASAPPVGNLWIGYQVIQPPLNPEIGFIKRGDAYYATVVLPNRQFTSSDAFFTVPRPRRVQVLVGGQVLTMDQQLQVLGFAGTSLRLNDRSTFLGGITTGTQMFLQYQHRVF